MVQVDDAELCAFTMYDNRIAGVSGTIAKRIPTCPGPPGFVGDTLLFALCCDHFMHNLGSSYCFTTKGKQREMDIYIHTYYKIINILNNYILRQPNIIIK